MWGIFLPIFFAKKRVNLFRSVLVFFKRGTVISLVLALVPALIFLHKNWISKVKAMTLPGKLWRRNCSFWCRLTVFDSNTAGRFLRTRTLATFLITSWIYKLFDAIPNWRFACWHGFWCKRLAVARAGQAGRGQNASDTKTRAVGKFTKDEPGSPGQNKAQKTKERRRKKWTNWWNW